MIHLAADYTFHEGRFHSDLVVSVEAGRIVRVAPRTDQQVQRLARRALVPGLVNAHSHAFQRAIRGRTEFRDPTRPSDDFWSWRECMYAAARSLTPEEVEVVSRMAFVEMVLSGITSVGEFHYLHHQPDGTPYDDPNELSHRVLSAAESAGLAPVLLKVAYARAGFGKEPNPGQARFLEPDVETYLEHLEQLRQAGQAVGVTPHSVRAVPGDWLGRLGEYAAQHGLPLHMHVSEQPRELEECQAEHGLRPIQLLAERGLLGPRFVGVHAIHLEADEIEALGRTGSRVCSCPTTERNLGDGVVPAERLYQAGAGFCFGSDSNAQIDLLEDARQLDYHLRLVHLQRAVLGQGQDLAGRLFEAATAGGARALGLETGGIQEGLWADLVALDLDDPSIVGAPARDLLSTIVFSLERTAVKEVWCRGRQVVSEGHHPRAREAGQAFSRVMRRLTAQP
ncbi:MAG: formimidoylglutamate deiminase [Candidatus Eremiobacteraeota bacterium]|nr:formimidoylglutamate deiminase [Candidatus Eremiobacteraeota bacterium]